MKTKKAQIKIQEMAFVLIAIVIFFVMIALIYFSIRMSSMRESVNELKEESAKVTARKLADIPEFSWAACSGCVDADKIIALKEKQSYKNFWNLNYLAVEKIYPNYTNVECTINNYPNCRTITVINKTRNKGVVMSAFVSICSYEPKSEGYTKCELGKIYASSE